MNSRERVLRAVNFEKPDRVPIDLGSIRASGINAAVYDKLKRRMGITTPTKIHDPMQILAEVELEVLERLHADVLPLDTGDALWAGQNPVLGHKRSLFCGQDVYFPPDVNITVEKNGDWVRRDNTGKAYARMPKDGYYFDFIRPTMSSKRIDPDAFKPGDSVSDEELKILSERAKFIYKNTDKAILGWGACISMMGLSALLADNITQNSLDEWLIMLIREKETANEMMGRYVEAVIKKISLYHQAVGDYCFGWGVASDDAGTQINELIAPELFTEMIQPHYKRLCDWIHENTEWKTYLHSCGSIFNFIPGWIDAGIDILNPVQISAARMEPNRLMENFGGRIVFWGGGCDTQKVLPLGSPSEVREHVRENMRFFAREDGGFVFTQVHNIQQNVPVENVEAMFAAAYEFGVSGPG
jgi:uroporphyrinogen decarboxylase